MDTAPASAPPAALARRALALFVNFLLVILAYYQVKAASRSLVLEHGGAALLPYVWIGSAVFLLGFIGIYNRLVARFSRLQVVVGSLASFALVLGAFRWLLDTGGLATVVSFYIFVDIFSVVLVEQFWSLTNSVVRLDEGRRSYWFVASGGLVGGIAGGVVASALLAYTPMHTEDLLLSCGALLLVTAGFNLAMARRGLHVETTDDRPIALAGAGLHAVVHNRYLVLIALIVCLSQLAEPVVEYQFMSAIDQVYDDKDVRTRFIANFFSLMGLAAIAVNLVLTPFVHRRLGVVAGLAVQPLLLGLAALTCTVQQGLAAAGAMKIADRGLSYSINRASKELMYVPIDPVLTYQAKAWIDMLGYRLFKIAGSGLIVLVTATAPAARTATDLAWLTFSICLAWLLAVHALGQEQRRALVAARV
jgi:AAA family ATP:ADP antiporter